MLKKTLFILLVIAFVLGACSSSDGGSNATLDDYINAFIENGVEVDKNEKPVFGVIGAIDGVIFYLENSKVAIYEYETEKTLNAAKSEFDLMKNWPSSGKYLLETKNESAMNIFKSVE